MDFRASTDHETVRTVDDDRIYVVPDDHTQGSAGPFFVAYSDTDHTERYGYVCGECDGLAVMDPMGRLECRDCHNSRQPTQWDAAYL